MMVAARKAGPAYPGEGNPCNGCGYCCAMQACKIAVDMIGADPAHPCPALENDEVRFYCGLVRHPSQYVDVPSFADPALSEIIAQMLGAGRGCDATAPEPGEMPLVLPPVGVAR